MIGLQAPVVRMMGKTSSSVRAFSVAPVPEAPMLHQLHASGHLLTKRVLKTSEQSRAPWLLQASITGALPALAEPTAVLTLDPAAAASPARTQVAAGINISSVSRDKLFEYMANKIDKEVSSAKYQLGLLRDAPQELLLAIDAYAANLKQAAINKLQVSPCLQHTPDTHKASVRLAVCCMMALSFDNHTPELTWTRLHAAVGVPLLLKFMSAGHVDSFGLPVFTKQAIQQDCDVSLSTYHKMLVQNPWFVGRFVDYYWDDCMRCEPYPFPVVSVAKVAHKLLSQPVLESVLGGFRAGRGLLGLARSLGLGGMGAAHGGKNAGISSTAAVAGGCEVTSTSSAPANASWFDLIASRPLCLLGVFLMSRPDMPFRQFLAAAAAEAASARNAGTLSNTGLAQDSCSHHLQDAQADEEEPSVCDGFEGGRMWGVGHITAVGAGDKGGSCTGVSLSVAVLGDREREGGAACEGVKQGKKGVLRRVGAVLRRACRLS